MTITAKIIADSISPQDIRLTTMQLRYPRFIHAEFMTHRVFSRNASSSRAVPVSKLIEDIEREPATPIHWGRNQKGMQARDELTGNALAIAKLAWDDARIEAVIHAQRLHEAGAHKQIVNRILEPFSHINVVVTATEWANFFALRRHEDAQPEIKALADAMWEAMQANTPETLTPGQWHLPYTLPGDYEYVCQHLCQGRITRDLPSHEEIMSLLRKISVSRCARTSYLTHEGRHSTVEEDLALYDRIIGHTPMHASPAEHQATPDETQHAAELESFDRHAGTGRVHFKEEWKHPEQHGNLRGWRQYRKMLPNECVEG